MSPGPASRASAAAAQAGGEPAARTLVAVFASPVSGYLLRYAADAGFRTLLVEPDAGRAEAARMAGFPVLTAMPDDLDDADVVVTDHHRDELGVLLRDALATKARWVGIMGNPRHAGPHVAALTELGVADGGHRPGAPSHRAQHRLPHPAGDRHLHPRGPARRPQLPPRRLRLLENRPPERTRLTPSRP